MRRVDRRTNALQTDQRTDTASYRGALSHLKRLTMHSGRSGNAVNACKRQKIKIVKFDGLTDQPTDGQTKQVVELRACD